MRSKDFMMNMWVFQVGMFYFKAESMILPAVVRHNNIYTEGIFKFVLPLYISRYLRIGLKVE